MTPEDRKALAEQLLSNPLWPVLMEQVERDAIERMVQAKTDFTRMEAQSYVRAARNFRQDCEANLRNNQPKKAAPA